MWKNSLPHTITEFFVATSSLTKQWFGFLKAPASPPLLKTAHCGVMF